MPNIIKYKSLQEIIKAIEQHHNRTALLNKTFSDICKEYRHIFVHHIEMDYIDNKRCQKQFHKLKTKLREKERKELLPPPPPPPQQQQQDKVDKHTMDYVINKCTDDEGTTNKENQPGGIAFLSSSFFTTPKKNDNPPPWQHTNHHQGTTPFASNLSNVLPTRQVQMASPYQQRGTVPSSPYLSQPTQLLSDAESSLSSISTKSFNTNWNYEQQNLQQQCEHFFGTHHD